MVSFRAFAMLPLIGHNCGIYIQSLSFRLIFALDAAHFLAYEMLQRLYSLVSLQQVFYLDLQKKVETRQTLDAQLNENKIVKEELSLVKDDTKVYKLIGTVEF